MIMTYGNEHYTIPDEVAEKLKRYEKIVKILEERSPYGGNRETCDMIRAIVKGEESMKKKVKRTERGWAGHLIVSYHCKFRRNTLLEYKDKKWIVSTVGAYINSDREIDMIGHNRWYETMAFVGTECGGYIDADVSQEIHFDSDWGLWAESWEELQDEYPLPDNAANEMHERIVELLMQKITVDEA